mmetsp:Transcript_2470/g.5239  ORF Transcript_2470/g.5239 Transcript_2470/m.5239 type:complete len:83 (-) Transcript_2470:1751-1999(-)
MVISITLASIPEGGKLIKMNTTDIISKISMRGLIKVALWREIIEDIVQFKNRTRPVIKIVLLLLKTVDLARLHEIVKIKIIL